MTSSPGLYERLRQALAEERGAALVTHPTSGAKLLVVEGNPPAGSLGSEELDAWAVREARQALAARRDGSLQAPSGEALFLETFPPPEHLLIFGAVHTAIPLTAYAKVLGLRVTVVDPRAKFANRERLPQADEIVLAWPQEAITRLRLNSSTYACILSHDPKIDHPTLAALLDSPVAYIGAIGSKETQRQRREWLGGQGFSEDRIRRLYGPVGLPIGGSSPEEIALAIIAEIQAVRRGRRDAFGR